MNWCGRSLLHSPVKYGLCLTQKDFDAAVAKFNGEGGKYLEPSDSAKTWVYEDSKGVRALVCLRPYRRMSVEKVYAALVHEAVHIWQEIRAYIGESKAGDEQEAYCIERIAYNLMQSYRKQTNK